MSKNLGLNDLDERIDKLQMSVRLENILTNMEVLSLKDLIETDSYDLFKQRDCGEKSVAEFLSIKKNLLNNKAKRKKISFKESSNFTGLNNPDERIDKFLLSVRLENILTNMGVFTIKDLLELEPKDLSKRKDCGKKSIDEFIRAKEKVLSSEGGNETLKFMEIVQLAVNKECKEKGRQETILSRLAGDVTLNEAGIAEDITRERIRQIEKKCVRVISTYQEEMNLEIVKLLDDRSTPLSLQNLERENPWFSGLNKFITSPKGISFFKWFPCENYKVEVIEEHIVFSKKESPYFEELFRISKQFLMDEEEDILEIARISEREDITNFLISSWSKLPRSRHKYGTKYAQEILEKSNKLLRLREVVQLLSNDYSLKLADNEVSNALSEVPNCHKFSVDGWGLEEKFGLFDGEELQQLGEIIVNIMNSDSSRYWHCSEIADEVWKNPPQFFYTKQFDLNQWQINWVLNKISINYPQLFKTKRLVWEILSNEPKLGADISDILTVMLEEKGSPISKKEVRSKIAEKRGLSSAFQIHPGRNPNIIEINPEEYGLRNRDIEITDEEEKALINFIKLEFKKGKEFIHPYEIDAFRTENQICVDIDLYLISRLLRRHNTQKISTAKYFWVRVYQGRHNEFLILNPNSEEAITTSPLMKDPAKITSKELKKVKKGTPLSELF